MSIDTRPSRSAIVPFALAVFVVVAGPAAAVSAIELTNLTNDTVESGATTSHTLEMRADGISADGTVDEVFVVLPDTYAGNVSFSTVAFQNRSSGATVPISSSTSIVDGPDGDGVQETLRTGLSQDADYETDDLNATYEFELTHPVVRETTTYDVTITIVDSATATSSTTATDAITVEPTAETTTGGGSSGDGTETTAAMDSETAVTTATTEAGSGGDGDDASTDATSGSGTGFAAVAAVLALLALGLFVWRRE